MNDEPRLDPEALRRVEAVGGDDLVARLLELVLSTVPARLAEAERASAMGEREQVRIQAHTLRSSAGNVGARRLARRCAALEEAAAGADVALPALLDAARGEWDLTRAELERRLRGAGSGSMTTPGLLLRAGRRDDAAALARLRWAFRCELARPAEAEEAFLARCTGWMAARLGEDLRWRCWVAEVAGEIVGNLWLERLEKMPNPIGEPELHAYVTNLYVVPSRRAAGIGGLLLEVALDFCRGAGVDVVLLWPSARSRSLYERHGFAVRDDVLELRPAGGARVVVSGG
jgi:HPt (histidine-containing phosphotransfer) domain-containing protein/N-acetylglutamate synthase-like GNAT family acetyltransferase